MANRYFSPWLYSPLSEFIRDFARISASSSSGGWVDKSVDDVAYTRRTPLPFWRFHPSPFFSPRISAVKLLKFVAIRFTRVPRKSRLTARSLKLCSYVVHKNVPRRAFSGIYPVALRLIPTVAYIGQRKIFRASQYLLSFNIQFAVVVFERRRTIRTIQHLPSSSPSDLKT